MSLNTVGRYFYKLPNGDTKVCLKYLADNLLHCCQQNLPEIATKRCLRRFSNDCTTFDRKLPIKNYQKSFAHRITVQYMTRMYNVTLSNFD